MTKTDDERIQEQARIYGERIREYMMRKVADKRAKNEVPAPTTKSIYEMDAHEYGMHRNAQLRAKRFK